MAEDKLLKDLRKSKLYITGANLIASILFVFAAIYLKNYWLFLPVTLLVAASISAFFLYRKIENKYRDKGLIK
jgi:hypothetical protein